MARDASALARVFARPPLAPRRAADHFFEPKKPSSKAGDLEIGIDLREMEAEARWGDIDLGKIRRPCLLQALGIRRPERDRQSGRQALAAAIWSRSAATPCAASASPRSSYHRLQHAADFLDGFSFAAPEVDKTVPVLFSNVKWRVNSLMPRPFRTASYARLFRDGGKQACDGLVSPLRPAASAR